MNGRILIATILAMLCLAGSASAATNSRTYLDTTAEITTPDSVTPGTPFSIDYYGIVTGSSFGVTAWFLYEGGTCADPPTISGCTGTFLDGDGFVFGTTTSGSYTATKPAGTYTYWFCMGNRFGGHGWYDVCVESGDVVVGAAGDADRGHGNDPDGIDEDNPGKGCENKSENGNRKRC